MNAPERPKSTTYKSGEVREISYGPTEHLTMTIVKALSFDLLIKYCCNDRVMRWDVLSLLCTWSLTDCGSSPLESFVWNPSSACCWIRVLFRGNVPFFIHCIGSLRSDWIKFEGPYACLIDTCGSHVISLGACATSLDSVRPAKLQKQAVLQFGMFTLSTACTATEASKRFLQFGMYYTL